jgi:uncharacterized protein YwqG
MCSFGPVEVVLAIAALALVVSVPIFSLRRRRQMAARPRITAQEMQDFFARIAADTRDSLVLTLHAQATPATATRIGGHPWADPARPDWPLDADGAPMAFLGQINFGNLPPLPDFPDRGLLQVFVCYESEGTHLRYTEAPVGEGLMGPPESLRKAKRRAHPFSPEVFERGYAVTAEPRVVGANWTLWPHSADDMGFAHMERLPEPGEAETMVATYEERMDAARASLGVHWIGGHPSFVQEDIRNDERYRKLDRVILHLGEEGNGKAAGIRIGDGGELNVMIARGDLIARRWERAVFTWDCY